jgi:hypothetical protein
MKLGWKGVGTVFLRWASAPRIAVLPPIRSLEPTYDDLGHPAFGVVEVWFVNRPPTPTDASVARHVSAQLDFFDFYSDTVRLPAYGRWALTIAPGHLGFRDDDHAPVVDIPPGVLPVKLLVLLKYPDDAAAYVFAEENLLGHRPGGRPDGRHPQYELPSGQYRLRVTLVGQNLNQAFEFDVENPGVGAMPAVTVRSGR